MTGGGSYAVGEILRWTAANPTVPPRRAPVSGDGASARLDAAPPPPRPAPPEDPLRRVTLALRGGATAVEGFIELDDAPPRAFSGWLELAAALESLLDPRPDR